MTVRTEAEFNHFWEVKTNILWKHLVLRCCAFLKHASCMYASTEHDGKHCLCVPADMLCLVPLPCDTHTIMYYARWLSTSPLDGSTTAMSDGMRWQIKGQYVRAQPPCISRSSTVAVSSIRIESYIPYGRLNHFCGSRSHSPQPPRVNVNSTIRKALGRSLQHLLSLTSSYWSHFMQRGQAVATDLGWKWACE